MDQKKIELLERSSQVFMRLGIKSVTLDDLVRELSISKKTIYKYFEDKNDLVMQIIEQRVNFDQEKCREISVKSENAIDELILISKMVVEQFTQINPSVFLDLQRHHPDAWGLINQHKHRFVLKMIKDNIVRGIEEGLYRANIRAEVIAQVYVGSIDMVMKGDVFPWPEFKFDQVFLEIIRFNIRGLANENGVKYLKERLTKEEL